METPEQNWDAAARMYRLPDTEAAREAFYHGARYALAVVVDALPDDVSDAANTLNDHLRAFSRTIRGK